MCVRSTRGAAIAVLAGMACVAALVAPQPAAAAERWTIRGAGWGHGIGMSQYGAFGFARRGRSYRDILSHYYTGTRIERRGASLVRVLIEGNRSSVSFTGATRAGGRGLKENSVYRATRSGSAVVLRSASGRRLASFSDVMQVGGGATVRLLGRGINGVGNGLYRGAIDVRPASGYGLNAINTVGIESYLQGVVPAESPPIWPDAALQAQAVAARSYALATNVSGKGFEQYPDTRSQVYRGYGAETASTNNAIAATRGEVVTYGGRVIVTYFFSTSGGYTENVENVFTASDPKPWLKGVRDPYDDASPYHRWGPYTLSRRSLAAKLGSWVRGSLRKVDVIQRGVSPRVVRARVKGSRGSVTVNGSQLRARLGLRDSWVYLRRVSASTSHAEARTSSGTRPLEAIHGTVEPAGGRFVTLERERGGRWAAIEKVPLFGSARSARYRFHVAERGRYRVVAGWAPGPPVLISP